VPPLLEGELPNGAAAARLPGLRGARIHQGPRNTSCGTGQGLLMGKRAREEVHRLYGPSLGPGYKQQTRDHVAASDVPPDIAARILEQLMYGQHRAHASDPRALLSDLGFASASFTASAPDSPPEPAPAPRAASGPGSDSNPSEGPGALPADDRAPGTPARPPRPP
jgi:hypothetical protein